MPVYGIDASGHPCIDQKVTPKALKKRLANLTPCLIGLEACGRAHQWAREIQAMGHEVRLVSPQYVKPYVLTNKNDRADAQAVCETIQRPHRRFVGIKSADPPTRRCTGFGPWPSVSGPLW